MGFSDVPPEHAPAWLVPVAVAFLAIGALGWDLAYLLMVKEAFRTEYYGMPIVPLALNISWEIVYFGLAAIGGAFVEAFGLLVWLLFDLGVVFSTVKVSQNVWGFLSGEVNQRNQNLRLFMAKHMGFALAVLISVGAVVHLYIARWWLGQPGRGWGRNTDKAGKFWMGHEGHDTTELAFWTASTCQVVLGADSLRMLYRRRHSGGTSLPIWACRLIGSVSGLRLANGLLWWYWPEAHSYFIHPLAIALSVAGLLCDIVYGVSLYSICRREKVVARKHNE